MLTEAHTDILISIVIVNYKVPELLVQALRSLRCADLYEKTEVVVVDNASNDNSSELVKAEFPQVLWIGLKSNIGFGKACNVGVQSTRGTYLLFLNPDTVVSKNSLSVCVDFMKAHPEVGVLGPKILNPDGSLQRSCRRNFPTPPVAFYHFSGLGRLFPKSKRFGRYNLTFMDPDESAQVDAISGSFMFMVRSVFVGAGGFDERFFMYGEDLDLCWRVREKGYKVWYHPATQIIHFKGKSSLKRIVRSRAAFYEAMILFSRKYRHIHGSFFPSWLVYVGIMTQAVVHIGASLFRSLTACFIDLVLINLILAGGIVLRFALESKAVPYHSGGVLLMSGMHALLSGSFLLSFWYRGIYLKERYSARNAFMSGLLASVVFMACIYFIRSMAFSRIAFAVSSLVISILLVAWREFLPRMTSQLRRLVFTRGRVIILGNGPIARRLISNVEEDATTQISGIVWPVQEKIPGEFEGYPVLGAITEIRDILERLRIDALLIATKTAWYSYIIEALASSKVRNLTIRWVPHQLLDQTGGALPSVIPLRDFSV